MGYKDVLNNIQRRGGSSRMPADAELAKILGSVGGAAVDEAANSTPKDAAPDPAGTLAPEPGTAPLESAKSEDAETNPMMLALAAALPSLLGAAFGGAEGGSAGASAGGKAVADIGAADEKRHDRNEKKQEKLDARATASAEKALDRASKEELARQRSEDLSQNRKNSEEWRREMYRDRSVRDAEKAAERRETADVKRDHQIADKIGNAGDIFGALDRVEELAKFRLEDYDGKNNEVAKVDPKTGNVIRTKVDLPGINVPLVGHVNTGGDARLLDGAIAKVFNVELKDRSGAAVTDSELDRLRNEFAAGKYNTESEKLVALQQYKIAAERALRNAEARDPEAAKRYGSNGGFTSDKIQKGKQVPSKELIRAELARREAMKQK